MPRREIIILIMTVSSCQLSAPAKAEPAPAHPALDASQPIATCQLQTIKGGPTPRMDGQPMLSYGLQTPPDDPLSNYERTPLGDWQLPADVDRNDPWVRFLLLDPKRPVVLDLAIFIYGKPFRDARETWLDELLAADKSSLAAPTKQSSDSSNEAPAQTPANSRTQPVAELAGSTSLPPTAAEAPTAKPQARHAITMQERMANHLATNSGTVGRAEIRWLAAEWGAGPAIVVLAPSLSWQRATAAPLLALLDRDRDGALSAAEIAQTNEVLQRADADQDDVVEVNEIRRAANQAPAQGTVADHSLLVPLDEHTDWKSLAATLGRVYGQRAAASPAASTAEAGSLAQRIRRGGPAIEADELQQLSQEPADASFRIDFAAEGGAVSGISVVALGPEFGSVKETVSASTDVITLDLGADYVEFSAAQMPTGADKLDANGSQVAIGAVIDGNPLLRLLDADQDQRLTARERQQLSGILAALDRDGDGQVGQMEMPIPIRVAVTLGPHAHEMLAAPTGAARSIAPRDVPIAPAWFLSMDKNGDRDLSRGEFLGTNEQFQQFDADVDGLLSITEVLKLDRNKKN